MSVHLFNILSYTLCAWQHVYSGEKYGAVTLLTSYRRSDHRLRVEVLNAVNLLPMDSNGRSTCHVDTAHKRTCDVCVFPGDVMLQHFCQVLVIHLCSCVWSLTTFFLRWNLAALRSKTVTSILFSMRRLNCKLFLQHLTISFLSLGCLCVYYVFDLLYLHPCIIVWFPWNSARRKGLAWRWPSWTMTPWVQMILKVRPSWASSPYQELVEARKEMAGRHSRTPPLLRYACPWCILNLTVWL